MTAGLLLLAQTESFAKPSRTEVTTNCIETLAEARAVSGWRNAHLRYHLKDGAKCWFNPEEDEMPTRLAKAKPKAIQLAAAATVPIAAMVPDSPQPAAPPSNFDERWIPGSSSFVDGTFELMCGGPCPQLVAAGYETYYDETGQLRYRRWQGGANVVRTQKFVR